MGPNRKTPTAHLALGETVKTAVKTADAQGATTEAGASKWGIKEFASFFDVTPRTIRFYEDKGLLAPARFGGVRVFSDADRLRFDKIMRGKRLGFSLDDIRAVLDVTDRKITNRSELLRRKANFEAVVAGLARRREDLKILTEDMCRVISVADDMLGEMSNGFAKNSEKEAMDVADLASRYQAVFYDMMSVNLIDSKSSPSSNPKKKLTRSTRSTRSGRNGHQNPKPSPA